MCSLVHPAGFFLGSLAVRPLIVRVAPDRLAGAGYVMIGIACLGMAALVIHAPTLWLVLWPVAAFSFGIAFVMPAMTAAALDSFPRSAGAAASMMGFLQMSFGLVCGSAGALLPNPVLAFSTIIPAMGVTAPALSPIAAAADVCHDRYTSSRRPDDSGYWQDAPCL